MRDRISAPSSRLGYVSFASKGYVAAKILAPTSDINSDDLKSFRNIRYHCTNNGRVDDPDQCSVLGSDDVVFASNPSLIDARNNPETLRYQDALNSRLANSLR